MSRIAIYLQWQNLHQKTESMDKKLCRNILYNVGKQPLILCRRYLSPCGEMLLGSLGGRLCLAGWTGNPATEEALARLCRLLRSGCGEHPSAITDEAARQLDEYFRKERRNFSIPLLPVGTDFRQEVWQHLLEVPYGTTLTYSGLASRVGNPLACRAVANACAANAIAVFVPCHRITGSGGILSGYNGGIERKRFLLELEARH